MIGASGSPIRFPAAPAQKQDVAGHEEFGVTAGPEHALGEDGTHGLEDDDDQNGVHQLPGDGLGLGGDLVKVDDGSAQDQNDQFGNAADDKAHEQPHSQLLLWKPSPNAS